MLVLVFPLLLPFLPDVGNAESLFLVYPASPKYYKQSQLEDYPLKMPFRYPRSRVRGLPESGIVLLNRIQRVDPCRRLGQGSTEFENDFSIEEVDCTDAENRLSIHAYSRYARQSKDAMAKMKKKTTARATGLDGNGVEGDLSPQRSSPVPLNTAFYVYTERPFGRDLFSTVPTRPIRIRSTTAEPSTTTGVTTTTAAATTTTASSTESTTTTSTSPTTTEEPTTATEEPTTATEEPTTTSAMTTTPPPPTETTAREPSTIGMETTSASRTEETSSLSDSTTQETRTTNLLQYSSTTGHRQFPTLLSLISGGDNSLEEADGLPTLSTPTTDVVEIEFHESTVAAEIAQYTTTMLPPKAVEIEVTELLTATQFPFPRPPKRVIDRRPQAILRPLSQSQMVVLTLYKKPKAVKLPVPLILASTFGTTTALPEDGPTTAAATTAEQVELASTSLPGITLPVRLHLPTDRINNIDSESFLPDEHDGGDQEEGWRAMAHLLSRSTISMRPPLQPLQSTDAVSTKVTQAPATFDLSPPTFTTPRTPRHPVTARLPLSKLIYQMHTASELSTLDKKKKKKEKKKKMVTTPQAPSRQAVLFEAAEVTVHDADAHIVSTSTSGPVHSQKSTTTEPFVMANFGELSSNASTAEIIERIRLLEGLRQRIHHKTTAAPTPSTTRVFTTKSIFPVLFPLVSNSMEKQISIKSAIAAMANNVALRGVLTQRHGMKPKTNGQKRKVPTTTTMATTTAHDNRPQLNDNKTSAQRPQSKHVHDVDPPPRKSSTRLAQRVFPLFRVTKPAPLAPPRATFIQKATAAAAVTVVKKKPTGVRTTEKGRRQRRRRLLAKAAVKRHVLTAFKQSPTVLRDGRAESGTLHGNRLHA